MWPVATTLGSADGGHLETRGFGVATMTGGTASIYWVGRDTTLPATYWTTCREETCPPLMELLEHLPKVQPHRLILGQVEAHGGLARCGGNPGLRHSQWLGEGWFSSQLPGFGPGQRNRGAALVSPLSLQARVLVFSGTPTHTHTHTFPRGDYTRTLTPSPWL